MSVVVLTKQRVVLNIPPKTTMKIRRGLNKRNYEYWRDEVYIKLHGKSEKDARYQAKLMCHHQELEILKDRIIKLEQQ